MKRIAFAVLTFVIIQSSHAQWSNPLRISGGSKNWNVSVQGHSLGTIHMKPNNSSNHFGNAITFGASDTGNGETGQAGIYVRSDGAYGTKMYFSTTNSYATGAKTAMMIDNIGRVGIGTSTPSTSWGEKLYVFSVNSNTGIKVGRGDGASGSFLAYKNDVLIGSGSNHMLGLMVKGDTRFSLYPNGKAKLNGGSANWNESTQGTTMGSLHLDPQNASDHFGSSITFGASDHHAGETSQAGIYVRSDGAYGTKMYFSTTNSYAKGAKTAMMIDNVGRVGIGTNSTGSHKLAVEGTIGARKVMVEPTGWSDFVFEKNYELTPLCEVEKYIAKNKHLPEIPAESEVLENGLDLGEMDAKLLQKIEELTLYLIQEHKNNQKLQKEVEKLKKELRKLKNE